MNIDIKEFVEKVAEFLPAERLISDPLRTFAYGTDASFYRLIPQLVIRVSNSSEIRQLLPIANQHHVPVTFRAAGTSLSGQAVTDSVLIQLDGNWKDIVVSDGGDLVSLQPGVIGAHANRALVRYQRKIGPDPASIKTAMIGGIAANNASGMCCGTAQNSYQTVQSMKIIFADGAFLDTADPNSCESFRRSHKSLLEGLTKLAADVHANEVLKERINYKYRIKNTTGYALNSLIDFDDPFEILQHLMIGSEGTLGFISEITYRTVPDPSQKACALVIFPDVKTACLTVPLLKESPATAVELIDPSSLRAIAEKPGMPEFINSLPPKAAALLVDTRAENNRFLQKQIQVITALLGEFKTLRPIDFTSESKAYAQIWAVRKGLFPAVGAVRDIGSTVVIEDVAFPVEVLADAVEDLQKIFEQFDYHDAIIFGHAMDGNLHFVFSQTFESQAQIDRYSHMLTAVADMVVNRYRGSLKAEHGTGRNMAPFVEQEWGTDAYQLMWAIKKLIDPSNILNPDVILTKNPNLHLENLKTVPKAHQSIDRCIECGFCEPVCPSLELTLTPRQRISAWREITRLNEIENLAPDDLQRLNELETSYQYQGVDTCAACGLCEINCPVEINTGDLIRAYRADNNAKSVWFAEMAANNYGLATAAARGALGVASLTNVLLGDQIMKSATGLLGKFTGGQIPQWTSAQPKAARHFIHLPKLYKDAQTVIYFPCCTARMMGPAPTDPDQRSLSEVVHSVISKAGLQIKTPANSNQLCCGMPFKSKGYPEIARRKALELAKALQDCGENQPILIDTSPCAQTLKELVPDLPILDPATFAKEHLLDHLELNPIDQPIMLHVPCSAQRSLTTEHMQQVTQSCAREVIVPHDIHCCGFAGDKGFNTPELTESALKNLKKQIPKNCNKGYSSSRTCEIGLSLHGNIAYQSIFYLIDEAAVGGRRVKSSNDRLGKG